MSGRYQHFAGGMHAQVPAGSDRSRRRRERFILAILVALIGMVGTVLTGVLQPVVSRLLAIVWPEPDKLPPPNPPDVGGGKRSDPVGRPPITLGGVPGPALNVPSDPLPTTGNDVRSPSTNPVAGAGSRPAPAVSVQIPSAPEVVTPPPPPPPPVALPPPAYRDRYLADPAYENGAGTDVAVLVVDSSRRPDDEWTRRVANALRGRGSVPTAGLFNADVAAPNGPFDRLFDGNGTEAKRLELDRNVDFLVLGRVGAPNMSEPGSGGVRSATVKLDLQVLDARTGRVLESPALSGAGPGFAPNEAVAQAVAQLEARVAAHPFALTRAAGR